MVVACVWFGALCSGLLWVIEVSEKGWCTFLTDSKRFITSLIAVDRVLDAVAVEARREWNQRKLQRNARRNGRRARLGRACERGASRQRVRRRTGARTRRCPARLRRASGAGSWEWFPARGAHHKRFRREHLIFGLRKCPGRKRTRCERISGVLCRFFPIFPSRIS